MKQHEDIIKEIKKIIEEQFYGTGFDVAMGEYSSQTGLSCIKENLLEKLDQLEQEQKEVEVIKGEWFQQTNWESKPIDFITLKSTIRTDDIDHIQIVKKRGV